MDATVWVRRTGAAWAYIVLVLLVVASVVFFALGNAIAGAALLGAPVLLGLSAIVSSGMKND